MMGGPLRPLALAELHRNRRLQIEEAVAVGLVLSRQLLRRTCHECGTSVAHVLDVLRAQDVVFDGGTVAIDLAAERTPEDLALPPDTRT